MSRSKKCTPIMGMTGNVSEKAFKRNEHQRERTHVRQMLRTTADDTVTGCAHSSRRTNSEVPRCG